MSKALATDLYELSMAASYLRRSMVGPATFSLFVRRLPPGRGFLVAAGLEDCLAFLESFAFADEDLAWLRRHGFDATDVDAFAGLRFTGDVHAVPEGRVVLASEPILEVTAPIAEAQLVETYLLNQITFQTAVLTKAARCRLAAGESIELVDFALRRTHGVDAGMAVARLSAMAGFAATSNVEAARRYGLRAAGTMAHSYVEAFPTEAEAFRAYAHDRPTGRTFLVDTYDTLDGVREAIDTIRELGLARPLAVCFDSGEVATLAGQARALLDEAGLAHVQIFASGGLDEYDLERLRRDGVPIDAAGVGTKLGVSADAPSLDSAYKLVAYGERPVLELSPGKATLPGPKQVWRTFPAITEDVLVGRDEPGPTGHEPLLVPVMRGSVRTGPPSTLTAGWAWLARDLEALPRDALDLHEPVAPPVRISPGLRELTAQVGSQQPRRRSALQRTGDGRHVICVTSLPSSPRMRSGSARRCR
jgi:nicotinate phosphoribosyltransferase